MILARYKLLFVLFSLILMASCNNDHQATPSTLELVRYDRLLMELDTQNIQKAFSELEQDHPKFTEIYFNEVLPIPGFQQKNDTFYTHLAGFISDPRIQDLSNMVMEQYPDLSEILKEMNAAFDKSSRWLPNSNHPRIYTFLSEFSFQRFLFEDGDREGLAIGLDLFLNEVFDYSVLDSPDNSFSNYLTRTFDEKHLVKKSVEDWLEDKMGHVKGDRLIDHMIFNGTKLYILSDILDVPDSVLVEYPKEKLDWIRENEKQMWSFYFKNDWFYTTDQYVIKRLVNPAPNSVALKMPASAPGQTGNYLGWRIIQSYMKRHPETTLDELLTTDAQEILETSKFKPGLN